MNAFKSFKFRMYGEVQSYIGNISPIWNQNLMTVKIPLFEGIYTPYLLE